MTQEPTVNVNIRMKPTLRDRLHAFAKQRGVYPSEIIRTALADYLDRHHTARDDWDMTRFTKPKED